jgi:hypothetical protein
MLYKPALSAAPTNAHLIWWNKDKLIDISLARAEFQHAIETVHLPAPLTNFKQTVRDIINLTDQDRMARGIARLKEELYAEKHLPFRAHSSTRCFECQVSLGKRRLGECREFPFDKEEQPGSSFISSHDLLGRLFEGFQQPYQTSSDNVIPEVSTGQADLPAKELERLLKNELKGDGVPVIIPLLPIPVSVHFCNGSYQELYDAIHKISTSERVQNALRSLSTSFSAAGRKAEPQGYEPAMAKVINTILREVATTFGMEISVEAYSSRHLTMSQAILEGGSKTTKCDPNSVFLDPKMVHGPEPGAVKKLADWCHMLVTGELKPEDLKRYVDAALLQTYTSVRQINLNQTDHILEQAFTCCGGVLRFHHFDAEGYAESPPYKISNNPFLFVNHVLLLSTMFTKDVILGGPHPKYPRGDMICWRDLILRGCRLLVHKVTGVDGSVRVEKNYWPTIRRAVPHENFVYQYMEKMIERREVPQKYNVSRMVDHDINLLTADICHVFGVQSMAPRAHIHIILDRCGMSIEHDIFDWNKLHCGK